MARPRLPSSMKQLHGTARPDRANAAEPVPPIGAPPMPANLSAAAAAVWPAVVESLAPMHVVAVSDGLALTALCETMGDLATARASLAQPIKIGRRIVAKGGAQTYVTVSRTGAVMVRNRPEVATIADADRRLMAWLARFGLSPADRSRVGRVPGPAADNPFLKHGVRPPHDDFDAYLARSPGIKPISPAPRRRV